MSTVSAKPARKGKQKPPAPPSTVLTITLNPDRTGNLIVKRGDLAAVSHFTYREMKDIFDAIRQGAAQLAEVEKNPPPKDLSTAAETNAARPPEGGADEPPAGDSEDESDTSEVNSSEPDAAVASLTEADPLLASTLPVDSTEPIQFASLPMTAENDPTAQLSLL